MSKYFVLNGHTLVYKGSLRSGDTQEYGVLGVSAKRPGSLIGRYSVMVGPLDKLTPATLADFKDFNVSPVGLLIDSETSKLVDLVLLDAGTDPTPAQLLEAHSAVCIKVGIDPGWTGGAKVIRAVAETFKPEVCALIKTEYVLLYLGIDISE